MLRLLVFFFFLLPMIAHSQSPATPFTKRLDGAWEFRQANTGDWLPISLPAGVHTALMGHGKLDDPYYRDHELKQQWIEQEDWEFQCTFFVQEEILARKHVEMRLQGLDTYAQIYLNDTLILETDNMFRSWTVDVKALLKKGDNTLHIYFESPVKKVAADWQELGYELPGGIRTMTRKAQFHYGWDWGPRLVGCGVYKEPELLVWDDFLIENVFFATSEIAENSARMTAHFRYRSEVSGKVTVFTKYNKNKSVDERVLETGIHEDSVWFTVPNPRLWWCAGMGEPYLYDFSLELRQEGKTLDKADARAGIRTIELVTASDEKGEQFYFKLNGKPVFCKGANYIPQDMFQERVAPAQYKRLLDDVAASNMNMLRVWGGGIYEDDLFYQLCDARGILVWQDFMYACALYPGNGAFLKNAAAEAREQIERLRQHPCIALWCGNNENNEAWHNWGWQMQFNEAQRTQRWRDYKTLFMDLLPAYVADAGGGVPYWESSPKFGRANPKSLTQGDAHYWGVWHDEEPFSVLDKKVPRFMSEFGFQSFPEWRTIESFSLPEDRALDSPVMRVHQKHPRGNALIAEYMQRDYRVPEKFADFVYVSQLLQAEGMRLGIEAHRRNKPYCMGTLYWQLNDVWPVASWSSIDYYGRWKALHYFVREAYSPVAALPFLEDDILRVYGVSDLPADTTLALRVRALSFEGKSLFEQTTPEQLIRPDSSLQIWQGALRTLLGKHKKEDAVVEITLRTVEGRLAYRRLFYFEKPKKLALPKPRINMQADSINDGYQITLQTDKLAKNVCLQSTVAGFFDDNYFDLLPGERKTVLFKTKQILDNPQAVFSLKHLGGVE